MISPAENQRGLGPEDAQTATLDDMTGHQILVLEGGNPTDETFYHELCHARVNELGFKLAEIRARNTIDQRRDSNQTAILHDTLRIVGEAYGDSILYAVFPAESSLTRAQLIASFASVAGLKTILRNLGLSGVGQGATFRVTLLWSGDNAHDANLAQMTSFAFRKDGRALAYYNQVFSTVSTLPPPVRSSSPVNLSNAEIEQISTGIVSLADWRKVS